jgi:plasmid stability protein
MIAAVKYAGNAAVDSMEIGMATLTVRNLDEELVRKLRIRAAEHGRSAEAEHREILREALEGGSRKPNRAEIVERFATFQEEVGGQTAGSSAELLAEARRGRMRRLTGSDEGF